MICGASRESVPSNETQPVSAAQDPASVHKTVWVCRECEAENDETRLTCVICGAKRPVGKSAGPAPKKTVGMNSRRLINKMVTPAPESERKPSSPVRTPAVPTVRAAAETVKPAPEKPNTKKLLAFRIPIAVLTAAMFVLFFLRYSTLTDRRYSIITNFFGDSMPYERLCSILLIVLSILPLILSLTRIQAAKRRLPIVISIIAAVVTTVYCAVIYFGSDRPTVVPLLIIACSVTITVLTILLFAKKRK